MQVANKGHRIANQVHSRPYEFTVEDIRKIEKIRDEKFSQWDWNFGYSPRYNFEKLIKTSGGTLEFHIDVEKGTMKDVKIYGDFFHKHDIDVIEKALSGIKHDPEVIRQKLGEFEFNEYFKNIEVEEFISGMF